MREVIKVSTFALCAFFVCSSTTSSTYYDGEGKRPKTSYGYCYVMERVYDHSAVHAFTKAFAVDRAAWDALDQAEIKALVVDETRRLNLFREGYYKGADVTCYLHTQIRGAGGEWVNKDFESLEEAEAEKSRLMEQSRTYFAETNTPVYVVDFTWKPVLQKQKNLAEGAQNRSANERNPSPNTVPSAESASRERAHQDVLARNAQRQREYEEALRARDALIEKNRTDHANAVARGKTALDSFDQATADHVRSLNATKMEAARRQMDYRAQLERYSATGGRCVPAPLGVTGAWMRSEPEARANLTRLAGTLCRGAPISNVQCKRANWTLPVPGRSREPDEFECSGTCQGALKCESGPSSAVAR